MMINPLLKIIGATRNQPIKNGGWAPRESVDDHFAPYSMMARKGSVQQIFQGDSHETRKIGFTQKKVPGDFC